MDKIEVARRTLGTALDLWLRRQDPVSIHCLAMAGGEIAERLAEKAGGEPFKNHVLETFPDMDLRGLRTLLRKFVNAFKHATDQSGQDRKDEEILEEFSPGINEHVLLIGWYDFGMAALPRPIEAQVFEAWYLAKYPEKVNPTSDVRAIQRVFPGLDKLSPDRQFIRLGEVIRKARKNGAVMSDRGTDCRPLILP